MVEWAKEDQEPKVLLKPGDPSTVVVTPQTSAGPVVLYSGAASHPVFVRKGPCRLMSRFMKPSQPPAAPNQTAATVDHPKPAWRSWEQHEHGVPGASSWMQGHARITDGFIRFGSGCPPPHSPHMSSRSPHLQPTTPIPAPAPPAPSSVKALSEAPPASPASAAASVAGSASTKASSKPAAKEKKHASTSSSSAANNCVTCGAAQHVYDIQGLGPLCFSCLQHHNAANMGQMMQQYGSWGPG